MPTYKFKCSKHGYFEKNMNISTFEKHQKNSYKGLCPFDNCDNSLDNIIGAPRVEFNTTGFYYTDDDPKATTEPEKTNYEVYSKKHQDK